MVGISVTGIGGRVEPVADAVVVEVVVVVVVIAIAT